MPDIRVYHVIFTRVERAYSPKQVSGYQVVYQSANLGKEIEQIEKRVQCFQPNGKNIDRSLFFWTDKSQAVVVRCIPLFKPNREIIDRDQRDAFLAHALVVSQADFARVKNDPFAIFEAAEQNRLFVSDVEHLTPYLTGAEQPTEQLMIAIRERQKDELLGSLSKDEAHKLYRLGIQAPTMLQQAQSFLMVTSTPQEVYARLSTIMLLLLPYERAACTFDTFVDGCLPSAGSFWLVGSGRAITNPGYTLLSLAERSFDVKESTTTSIDPKVRAYSEWLLHVLQNNSNLLDINEEVHSAQIIAEAFLNKVALPKEPLNELALKHFSEANALAIDNTLHQVLSDFFEVRLAEEIVAVLKTVCSPQEILSIVSREKCEALYLARLIYEWYLLNKPPESKYWSELLKFADQTRHARLLLLTSLKAHPHLPFPLTAREKLRTSAIKALIENGTLSNALNELLPVLNDEEFLTLVQTLLQMNVGKVLGPAFVQRAGSLQNKKVGQHLAKAVKKASQNVPSEFIKVLKQYS